MMEQFGNVYASLYPWLMGVFTVIVSLTDLRWYWVPDTAVAALILIQLAALRAGLVRPDPYVSACLSCIPYRTGEWDGAI